MAFAAQSNILEQIFAFKALQKFRKHMFLKTRVRSDFALIFALLLFLGVMYGTEIRSIYSLLLLKGIYPLLFLLSYLVYYILQIAISGFFSGS